MVRFTFCVFMTVIGFSINHVVAIEHSDFYPAQVIRTRAEVYSSPTSAKYVCDVLQRGAQVDVYLETADGYLAIRPTPGCYSWVESSSVEIHRGTSTATVTKPSTASWIGGQGDQVVQYIRMVKLDRDEVVHVLGSGVLSLGPAGRALALYRIAPPAGEYRWIHKRDVRSLEAEGFEATASSSESRFIREANNVRQVQYQSSRPMPPLTSTSQITNRFVPRWLTPTMGRPNSQRVAEIIEARPASYALQNGFPDTVTTEEFGVDHSGRTYQLSELELQLSQMVAQKTEGWDFTVLRSRTLRLLDQVDSVERAGVQQLLQSIARFQDIRQQRLDISNSRLGVVPLRVTNLNADTLPIEFTNLKPDTIDRGVLTAEAQRTPYEATGYLMQVHSTRRDAPRFALVDEQGDVKVFVTPVPGLNLSHYLKKHIGVFGRRGYLYRLKTQHITITRVVDLARHKIQPAAESE